MNNLYKKIRGVINKKYLRTPGVEYLLKNMNNEENKKNILIFGLIVQERTKVFKNFFSMKIIILMKVFHLTIKIVNLNLQNK